MDTNVLLISILSALAVGGIAYVFIYPILSGENRASKRQQILKTAATSQAANRAAELANRRRQLENSLKELPGKQNRKSHRALAVLIMRAGLEWSKRTFILFSIGMGLLFGLATFAMSGQFLFALPVMIVGGLGFPRWALSFMGRRRIKKFVNEFPNALDVITRGLKAGLPLGDCLRIISVEAAEPVKSEFRRIVEAQAVGLTVAEAVERMAERVPVTESNFFSIVISIQAKAGGNLSEALGNLSRVLRERKKMKGKVQAMAMEAKASAAIIGSLPFIVAGLVYFSSPDYIARLWTTNMGKLSLGASLLWMSIGIFTMKKMINFDL